MARSSFASLLAGFVVAVTLVLGGILRPPAPAAGVGLEVRATPNVAVGSSPPISISAADVVVAATDDPDPRVAFELPTATPETVVSAADVGSLDLVNPVAVAPSDVPLELGSTPTPNPARGPQHRAGGVPILMYHYIRVNPAASDHAGYILSVTPSDFAAQMRFLAEHGFTTVSMAQAREYVRSGKPLPPKPVALTFDDGYDDAFTAALPVLQRLKQIATFYIVTGFVGQTHYMSWNQVVALDQAGMEIGSHTVHHAGLPLLGVLARRGELTVSQQDLQTRLGHPVVDFCYPGGQINTASEIAVGQAGYLSATTTAYGRADVGDDPLRLPRIRVWGGEELPQFASLLGETATWAEVTGASQASAASSPAAAAAAPLTKAVLVPPLSPIAAPASASRR